VSLRLCVESFLIVLRHTRAPGGNTIKTHHYYSAILLSDNLVLNENLPTEYSINQNFPNPFNPSTKIQYGLPEYSLVTIKIFDLLGREVMTLVNEIKNAGRYEVTFKGENFSSGIYYYRIKAGNYEQIRKMILLK